MLKISEENIPRKSQVGGIQWFLYLGLGKEQAVWRFALQLLVNVRKIGMDSTNITKLYRKVTNFKSPVTRQRYLRRKSHEEKRYNPPFPLVLTEVLCAANLMTLREHANAIRVLRMGLAASRV